MYAGATDTIAVTKGICFMETLQLMSSYIADVSWSLASWWETDGRKTQRVKAPTMYRYPHPRSISTQLSFSHLPSLMQQDLIACRGLQTINIKPVSRSP